MCARGRCCDFFGEVPLSYGWLWSLFFKDGRIENFCWDSSIYFWSCIPEDIFRGGGESWVPEDRCHQVLPWIPWPLLLFCSPLNFGYYRLAKCAVLPTALLFGAVGGKLCKETRNLNEAPKIYLLWSSDIPGSEQIQVAAPSPQKKRPRNQHRSPKSFDGLLRIRLSAKLLNKLDSKINAVWLRLLTFHLFSSLESCIKLADGVGAPRGLLLKPLHDTSFSAGWRLQMCAKWFWASVVFQ